MKAQGSVMRVQSPDIKAAAFDTSRNAWMDQGDKILADPPV